MKKIVRLLLIAIVVTGFVSGCGRGNKDEFAPYRNMTAQALFMSAETQLAKGHNADAVKRLEALDAIYPFGPYAEQGDLDIIYAYYQNDDQPSAVAAADRFIRLYPESKNVDYAYYMKGLVSYNLGLSWIQQKLMLDPTMRDPAGKQQSFLAFQGIVTEFPDSYYAPDAVYRMAIIRNMMARREVAIAQFYMSRKAYLAAANRAAEVVRHYDGSPEVIPALTVMAQAYQKLGLTDMQYDTLAVFQASYPNAPQLQQLLRTANTPPRV